MPSPLQKRSEDSSFLAFAKSTGVFFVGNTLSKVITLLLLPLYTNMLPTEDYGYYDLTVTCVTLLTAFLYCDIWSSVMRFMRDDLEGDNPRKVISSGWMIFLCSTILYYAIGLSSSLVIEIPNLPLILVYGTFLNVQSMFSCIARGWGKNFDFSLSGVMNTAVNVLLNFSLILVVGIGYEALYISYIFGCLVQCGYLFFKLKMWRSLKMPTFRQTKELFLYTAPLGINAVSYWLLNSFGRLAVFFVLSLSANGIFAIGSKFGSTVALATTCFTYAWQDIAFTKDVKPGSFYSNATSQYAGFLIAAVALLMPLISLFFPILVGNDYVESYGVIPSFLLVAALSAISTFVGNIFYVIKDTKAISRSMIVACACNVAICYPLTISFGCLGANISVLVSFAVNIGIRFAILRKSMDFEISPKSLMPSICLLVFSSFVYELRYTPLTSFFLLFGLVCFAYMYRTHVSSLVRAIVKKSKESR